MAILPVSGQVVSVAAGPVASTDIYKDGLRWADNAVRADYGLAPIGFSQGLPVDADGMLCLVDATAELPEGVAWQNGLPLAGGLCVSTDDAATWSNGLPVAENGAVCV